MSSDDLIFQRGRSAHWNFRDDEQGNNSFSAAADLNRRDRSNRSRARHSLMIKKIAYLGLGTMGSGMASNLLKASYELTVWNRSAEKCDPFARKGAHVADTPAAAASDADLVMYMLTSDEAVEDVVF